MSEFEKTYGEQIIEYEQNKALWNSINSIIDRIIILVGEIVLIIQLFKTEKKKYRVNPNRGYIHGLCSIRPLKSK